MHFTLSFKIMYLLLVDGQYNRNMYHILKKQIQLKVDAICYVSAHGKYDTLLSNHSVALQ
jgi:hypothetical protein